MKRMSRCVAHDVRDWSPAPFKKLEISLQCQYAGGSSRYDTEEGDAFYARHCDGMGMVDDLLQVTAEQLREFAPPGLRRHYGP